MKNKVRLIKAKKKQIDNYKVGGKWYKDLYYYEDKPKKKVSKRIIFPPMPKKYLNCGKRGADCGLKGDLACAKHLEQYIDDAAGYTKPKKKVSKKAEVDDRDQDAVRYLLTIGKDKPTKKKVSKKKLVCLVCGIPFIEGKGFIGKHKFPCANSRYGWSFVEEAKPTKKQSKKKVSKCKCDCHIKLQTCNLKNELRKYLGLFCCKDYQVHFNFSKKQSKKNKMKLISFLLGLFVGYVISMIW